MCVCRTLCASSFSIDRIPFPVFASSSVRTCWRRAFLVPRSFFSLQWTAAATAESAPFTLDFTPSCFQFVGEILRAAIPFLHAHRSIRTRASCLQGFRRDANSLESFRMFYTRPGIPLTFRRQKDASTSAWRRPKA